MAGARRVRGIGKIRRAGAMLKLTAGDTFETWGGGGGSRKFGWDEWLRFWKPLPYFRQPRTQALRKGSWGGLKTRKKLFEPSPVPLGANRREFGPPHDPLRSAWVRTRHYFRPKYGM